MISAMATKLHKLLVAYTIIAYHTIYYNSYVPRNNIIVANVCCAYQNKPMMLSVPSFLSQSTPSLTISETDSLYMAVTTLHQELKSYAPEVYSQFETDRNTLSETPKTLFAVDKVQRLSRGELAG